MESTRYLQQEMCSPLTMTRNLTNRSQKKRLVEAIENGNIDGVRTVLPRCVDLDFDVSREIQPFLGTGRSLLHFIIYRRIICGSDQRPAYLEVMRLLLDAGVDPNRVSIVDTPLNCAALIGDHEAANVLLQCGADPAGISMAMIPPLPASTEIYLTALHRAAENDDAEMARLLINAGADVNAPGMGGITALEIAIGRKHLRVAALLHEEGAKK